MDKIIRRRLSPIDCSYIDIFKELVSIPKMISHPNFTIEVILVQIEEIRENNGKGSWKRKGWSIFDKKLVRLIERRKFNNPVDFLYFIPKDIKIPFTNLELAKQLNKSLNLARKVSYCLKKMEIIKSIGKSGNTLLFEFNQSKI